VNIGEPGSAPEIGVYGAPRPAVPERVPLAPRTKGCASGGWRLECHAGRVQASAAMAQDPAAGQGDYRETKALLREQKLVTVCEEARCPNPRPLLGARHGHDHDPG
jgi:hypothetical protein